MKFLLRVTLCIFGLLAILTATGCNNVSKKNYTPEVVRFYLEADAGDAGASATLPLSGVQIALKNKPVIVEVDIVSVQLAKSDMGQFLFFQLTSEASRDLYRLTGNNQGRRLVLTINNNPVGARQIDRPFSSGSIATFVEIPDDLLPELVKNINKTSADLQKELAKH